jgi:hypothetical protein
MRSYGGSKRTGTALDGKIGDDGCEGHMRSCMSVQKNTLVAIVQLFSLNMNLQFDYDFD